MATTLHSTTAMRISDRLQRAGLVVLRYAPALILLWIGCLKFTAYEAKNIEPLVSHSPWFSWAYHLFGLQTLAHIIGITEIALGLLILSRPISARLCAIGSLCAIGMFLITLSFLLTTPGVWQEGYGFPFLAGVPGQFVSKDLVFLGAVMWSAGEALGASRIGSRGEVVTLDRRDAA